MKYLLNKFYSKNTIKNVGLLMSGSLVTLILPIAFSPIMTRLYDPEFYGVFVIYISISTVIGSLITAHYPQLILVVKEERESNNLVWISVLISVAVCVVSYFFISIYFIFSDANSTLGYWIFLTPLTSFLTSNISILLFWGNRKEKYGIMTSSKIMSTGLTIIIQLLLGLYINHSETGLILGFFIGQFFSCVFLFYQFKWKNSQEQLKSMEINSIRTLTKHHKSVLFFNTPIEVMNNLINNLPILILQKIAGPAVVANFSFNQRFLGIPQQILSSAIGDIFRQKASKEFSEFGNCEKLYTKTFWTLSLISFLPFLICIIFAPQIFLFLFGEKWQMAGVYAQILSPLYLLRFIVSPLSYTFFLANRLKEDLLLHLLLFFLICISFYCTNILFENKLFIIYSYTISYSIFYIIFLYKSRWYSKQTFLPYLPQKLY